MLHSPRFQVRILILSDRLEVAILNIVVRPLVVMERGGDGYEPIKRLNLAR